jgi:DNA-directed RNA polymerase subunit RPC12/RpoP
MLYENDQDEVFLCGNCDSEFTVTKLDDEEAEVCFCPYCGEAVVDFDDDDGEESDIDQDPFQH